MSAQRHLRRIRAERAASGHRRWSGDERGDRHRRGALRRGAGIGRAHALVDLDDLPEMTGIHGVTLAERRVRAGRRAAAVAACRR